MLSLIYARSENFCIGKAGRVPWYLPDEYAYFKRTTLGRPIIMGRKTYEDHQSLLPGRTNIVLTRRPGFSAAPGVVVVSSLARALELACEASDEVFVVGGVRLFETCFDRAGRVYESVVHTEIAGGDSFVPRFDFSSWSARTLEQHGVDEKHAFRYTALLHERQPGV